MPRNPQVLIFVGIKNTVMALDDRTGAEVWRTKLHSSDFVTVLWDGEALLVANGGEVWRLDPARGDVIWHSEMKRLGRGIVSLASTRRPSTGVDSSLAAEQRRRAAAAAVVAST